jgi:hypothetical protein
LPWDHDDDYYEYQREAAIEEFLEEQLHRIAEQSVFDYLAANGDAIETRVRRCLEQARALSVAGHPGAALVRAAAGIEVTIRFFLARPLVQGAFLSDDWAQLLSQKVLYGRTSEDRELLPAILRNWKIDITKVKLPDGSQVWDEIVAKVWPLRNRYVHSADDVSSVDAARGVGCLEALLSQVVDPLASRLGFTREKTGCWSRVTFGDPKLNMPHNYPRHDPFTK